MWNYVSTKIYFTIIGFMKVLEFNRHLYNVIIWYLLLIDRLIFYSSTS